MRHDIETAPTLEEEAGAGQLGDVTSPNSSVAGLRRVRTQYKYHDKYGNFVVKKVKIEHFDVLGVRAHKTFRILNRPTPKFPCLWEPSAGKFWRLIYRLPELRGPVARGEEIFLVEGEKDADAGADVGMATTCSLSRMLPEHLRWLRGAGIVSIIADRDAAGYLIAADRGALCAAAGLRHRYLLPATREPKSDLSDHLAAGYSVDELKELSARQLARRAEAAEEELARLGRLDGSGGYLEAEAALAAGNWSGEWWTTLAPAYEGDVRQELLDAGLSQTDAERLSRLLGGAA